MSISSDDLQRFFYSQFRQLQTLLRIEKPDQEQERKIHYLQDICLDYIQSENPEILSDQEVAAFYQRIQASQLKDTGASSTAGRTGSAASEPLGLAAPAPVPTSARLLFNLLADEFGKNSELESISKGQVLQHVIKYIEGHTSLASPYKDTKESILYELKKAQEIDSQMDSSLQDPGLSRVITEALTADKPFIIPGGWIGSPFGHAVYYEVIPQVDGTVNFRIFNTGDGITYHERTQVGVKEKVGFIEWCGINKEKIQDPHFARIIKEMTTRSTYPHPTSHSHTISTDYKAKDIYEGLKAFLRPRSIESQLDAPLMQPQKAGTCACRTLFAFLKSKLPIDEYRRLKLDLRIQALTGYISSPSDSKVSIRVRYQLSCKATEKLSRRVNDLFTKGVIESDTLIRAEEQLARAQDWLESHRMERQPLIVDQGPRGPVSNPLALSGTPDIASSLTAVDDIPSDQTPLSHIMARISAHRLNEEATFIDNIERVSAILTEGYQNKEYSGVHFAIVEIAQKIPSYEYFFETPRKTPRDLERAINALGTLSELFFKSCYHIQDASPPFLEKSYVLHKLLYTQSMLAKLFGTPDLGQIISHYSQYNPYIQALDSIINEEIVAIVQSMSSSKRIFPSTKTERYYHELEASGSPDEPFTKFLQSNYPGVYSQIGTQLRRDKGITLESKGARARELFLFFSPLLPVWLQSIKMSYLCLAHIQNLPIVPLKDSRSSLDFQFTHEERSTSIGLQGITPENYSHLPEEAKNTPDWSSIQTPIKNPMIKGLIGLLRSTNNRSSEKLLCSTASNTFKNQIFDFIKEHSERFPASELKELVHFFISDRFNLIEALQYFTDHPKNLSDIDYQQLFQIACFQSRSLHLIPNFKLQISAFLQKKIALSRHEGDSKTQVFLQRMGRYFKEHKCTVPDETEYLTQLLQEKRTTAQEKSLIYAELGASLSKKTSLTPEECKFLLKAKAWIEHAPIPLEWKDPKTCYDFEKALQKHSLALMQQVLPTAETPNLALLSEIYSFINERAVPEGLTWERIHSEGMSPRFRSSQSDFYDPMSGRFITIGLESYLPVEIRDDLTFKELFPDQSTGKVIASDTYEFKIGETPFLVKKTQQGLIIEQFKDGLWFRFIPNTELTTVDKEGAVSSCLESRYLSDKYNVWQSIIPPPPTESSGAAASRVKPALQDSRILVLYDKKTGEKSYQASYLNGSITSVIRLSDGANLGKSSQLLAHLEAPSYVQEWYKEGSRIQIELPRFKLSFTPEAVGRFQCKEHPGFFLSDEQSLRAVGPCKYALVLKNEKGQIRVLLPDQQLQAPKKKESLEPKFTRNEALQKGESADFTYFTYNLTSNGYLESSSREGYFYLIQTLAVHQEYKQAAYYLRNYGEKLSSYSQKEKETLQAIANIKKVTGDENGEQVAIALYANYLLATNIIKDPDALKALPELYQQYLDRLHNVTALRLSKDEEFHLLKSLLQEPLTEKFTYRLKQLEGSPQPVGSITPAKTDTRADITIGSGILRHLQVNFSAYPPPPPPPDLPYDFENTVLVTRSGDFIKDHLFEIIKIAITGRPEQKKWLETACLFIKTIDPTNASLGLLLEIILNNPSRFTHPPEWSTSQAALLSQWLSQTTETVQELAARATPSESVLRAPSHTPTSAASAAAAPTPPTDRPPIPIPPRDFIFSPDEVPPLSQAVSVSTWTTSTQQAAVIDSTLTEFLASKSSGEREGGDPLEIAEWTRLQRDARALLEKGPRTLYRLNKEIPEITSALQARESTIKAALTPLEDRMIEIAATLPEDPTARAVFLLNKRGKVLDAITLDDIFISLALKDQNRLLEKNPYLSQDLLNELYKVAGNYLQLASQGSQVERCLDLCDKISKESTEELIQQLGEQLIAKRCYDIASKPQYLVFEYYAGIIMREDQVNKLNDFLEGTLENPVMEMIMGSGKSKVLVPLLGLLRAKDGALSMIVVPAPLFPSVSSDTQAILQRAFSTSLKTRAFDRNSTFTIRSLQEIKTSLQTIIAKKQSLIMTSKTIQSLMIKFIECAYNLYENGKEHSEELSLMIDIIRDLQAFANPLIDEADTVLNVRHEVSFSLGEKVVPKDNEIKLIGTLYELLYSDPVLKRIARLESDPNPDAGAPPLSETLYHRDLKQPLGLALIRKLIQQGTLPESSFQNALNYIFRIEERALESKVFFESQSPDTQNLLALASEEICTLLPETLLKTSDEKYGLDKGVIAIPYSAANTPSHGSVFSNPYITMNYTYQIHTKNGIREDTLIHVINSLREKADFQVRNEGIELTATSAYQQFLLLKGPLNIPFSNNLHSSELDALSDQINSDIVLRQQLIEQIFLPQMEIFAKKLACNPINLAAFFSRVSGFTGTLWNSGSMHKKLQALSEAGTDAKTLNILMQKCTGPALIIPKVKGSSMFADLSAEKVGDYDALIDAGGYFKEGGNLSIARKMAIAYGRSVVFYNAEGVQTITNGTTEMPLSTSSVKEDERLTIYDQSHTTGADIKQKAKGSGLVTIGRGMLLRDLLQSVWRLRGLERGQSVQFVIDNDVASIIRSQIGLEGAAELGFKEILEFVIQNQASQQGNNNFKAFKQQLDNLSQNLLLEVMTDQRIDPARKKQAFLHLCRFWIKPANLTPAELFGTPAFERPSGEVLDEAARKCVAQLDAIGESLTFLKGKVDSLKAEIEQIKDRAQGSVHRMVISDQSDTDGTAELQSQLEAELHTELATESDNEFEKIELIGCHLNHWSRVEIPPTKCPPTSGPEAFLPVFPIASQMGNEPGLEEYKDLFEGIDISLNVLEWKQEADGRIHHLRLLGAHRTPFHHLLVDKDNVTLFTQIEHLTYHKTIDNYYNLTLGFTNPNRLLSEVAFQKIVKLKFLNGQSTFTPGELAFLKEWFTKAGVEKVWNLYTKHILQYQPHKKTAFSGSNLERLFKKLMPPPS